MSRKMYVAGWLAMLCLHLSIAQGQTSSASVASGPCGKTCQQERLDALFRAMDAADIAGRPKASDSTECSTYEGRDFPATLIDVCAKLKYVRTLPIGTETRFACPHDTDQLVGLSPERFDRSGDSPTMKRGKDGTISQVRFVDGHTLSAVLSPTPTAVGFRSFHCISTALQRSRV